VADSVLKNSSSETTSISIPNINQENLSQNKTTLHNEIPIAKIIKKARYKPKHKFIRSRDKQKKLGIIEFVHNFWKNLTVQEAPSQEKLAYDRNMAYEDYYENILGAKVYEEDYVDAEFDEVSQITEKGKVVDQPGVTVVAYYAVLSAGITTYIVIGLTFVGILHLVTYKDDSTNS